MPLYDYACACGVRFEVLVPSWSSHAPSCPECGQTTSRRPPAPAVIGSVAPPPPMSAAPKSWEGVGHGNRELITKWRHEVERRQEFEARHPEHAERREAIAAHEGAFERRPLTYKELAARAAAHKDATRAAAEASRERRTAGTGDAAKDRS